MPALNRVQLIGNLGKDPETHFTPTGRKVCTFPVAVSRNWKNSEGESQEATEWFKIDAWGHLGEICQDYLHKGRLIYLEGRLQTDRYEHEGEVRYITKVVAQFIQMLDRRHDEDEPVLEAEEPVMGD